MTSKHRSIPGPHKARFLSGLAVPPSAWQRTSSPNILSLNLTALGIDRSFFGGFERPSLTGGEGLGRCLSNQMELFYGGEAMTVARYPNLVFPNGTGVITSFAGFI